MGDIPVPRVAVDVEDFALPPHLAERLKWETGNTPPHYTVWFCLEDTADWRFAGFNLSYSMRNPPPHLLSEAWGSGERNAHGVHQVVRVTTEYLDFGNVTLRAKIEPVRTASARSVGMDISEFLRRGLNSRYKIDVEALSAEEHPCDLAKPLEEKHLLQSFEAKIH